MGDKKPKKKMLHTTHCELFELGDGQFQQVINPRRIAHYKGGSLVADVNNWGAGDLAYPFQALVSSLGVKVASDGARQFFPLPDDDKTWLAFETPYTKTVTWEKQSIGTLSAVSSTLGAQSVNLKSSIVHAGIFCKADYELLGGYNPGEIAFPYTLNGLTRSGDYFLDSKGNKVCQLRTPMVYDAADPTKTLPITYTWAKLDGRECLLFTLPSLAGMSRPVIDPTIALQPAAADGLDAILYGGAPDNNYGALTYIETGDGSGGKANSCIAFSLTSFPAGALFSAVTLGLYEYHTAGVAGNRILQLRRLLRNWGEATATWNKYDGSNAWTAGGAEGDGTDRAAAVSASVTQDATADNAFVNWTGATLTDDVQKFHNGAYSNYGWVMRETTQTQTLVNRFYSSDYATPANRPTLTVTYTLPVSGQRVFAQGFSPSFRGAFG